MLESEGPLGVSFSGIILAGLVAAGNGGGDGETVVVLEGENFGVTTAVVVVVGDGFCETVLLVDGSVTIDPGVGSNLLDPALFGRMVVGVAPTETGPTLGTFCFFFPILSSDRP